MRQTLKSLYIAALAVMGAMTLGCTSLENPEQPVKKEVTLTTTITLGGNPGSKALTAAGVKTFAVGEQLAVVYKNTSDETVKAVSTPLVAGDIRDEGKKADITVTLTDPAQNGALRYIYPAAMAKATIATDATIDDDGTIDFTRLNEQDGTLASLATNFDLAVYDGNLTGEAALPASATLGNQLTIGEFIIKESAGSTDITSSITRLTIKNGSDIYTVSTSSLSTIWVVMKPVTTGDITFYAAKGKELYKKTVSGKTLAAGSIYPVNVTASLVAGAVSGLFRIGDKLFYFSQGNLRATYNYSGSSWSWAFATNQWNYVGNAAGNTSVNGDGTVSGTENVTVDLFGWVGASSALAGVAQYGISNSTSTSNYGSAYNEALKSDWGNTIGSGWRTPSNDEFQGIFNNHIYGKATVNNKHGIILIPYNTTVASFDTSHDSWSDNSYSSAEWTTLEAAGAVFLPAAGYRYGSTVTLAGDYGFYWSSSLKPGSKMPYLLKFGDNEFKTDSYDYRYEGQSVRLIGE